MSSKATASEAAREGDIGEVPTACGETSTLWRQDSTRIVPSMLRLSLGREGASSGQRQEEKIEAMCHTILNRLRRRVMHCIVLSGTPLWGTKARRRIGVWA